MFPGAVGAAVETADVAAGALHAVVKKDLDGLWILGHSFTNVHLGSYPLVCKPGHHSISFSLSISAETP